MRTGDPELVPVAAAHRFDEAALARYLAEALPDFTGPMTVRQFQGGQSNPTYHLATADRAYVLRKKPGGALLPSAHAVDREYRIMTALGDTSVPVPRTRLLCTDPDVIGAMFFVMDHLPGRVFADRAMPGLSSADRRDVTLDMARVLAALHAVDPDAAGLGDYGRKGQYVDRQIARWSKQYAAASLPPEPAMDRLLEWLRERAPSIADDIAIAHGDYRLGNLMIHPDEPRVVGVLDWELSTLGHPLADLAYCILPWRLPPPLFGIVGLDVPGLPTEAEVVDAYERASGRAISDLDFFVAFSLYRWAAIVAGVFRRGLDGNAADADRAIAAGDRFKGLAEAGWTTAQAA